MKTNRIFDGTVPSLEVREEGSLLRISFDFEKVTTTIDEETSDSLQFENVDVSGRSYPDIVSAIITDRYPSDQKDAIISNYAEANDSTSDLTDDKRAEHLAQYKDFQDWRKHAKEIATAVLNQL